MAASPRRAKLGGAHGFYSGPRSSQAVTCLGLWRRSARVRPLIALSAAMGCLVSATPAAGSVVISIQGDAILVRGTEAASLVGTDGGTVGEAWFEPPPPVDPVTGSPTPPTEPIEAGPGCASRTAPDPYGGLYPGQPTFPPRSFVSCPTVGVARVDVDLGDGPNALASGIGAMAAAPQPLTLPVIYRGGSGVDQVGGLWRGTPVAMSAGSVVDGGGGDDKLIGVGGRYLGGPGNDRIVVQDLARDGAAGLTVGDGGEGDDTLSAQSPAVDPSPGNPDGDPVPESHLIGGPGNDRVNRPGRRGRRW